MSTQSGVLLGIYPLDKKGNNMFLDIRIGNARQWKIFVTAWAKANGLGNILSGDRFTGQPIIPALTAGRVDAGTQSLNW